jgi:galactoside O-acetyltransferase
LDVTRLGLRAHGEDVRIYPSARLIGPESIAIGSHVVVDDFVMLQSGERLTIGNYVHLAAFVSIMGGGVATIGDFVGLAAGARVLTGTDVVDGSGLCGPAIPAEMRGVVRPGVEIEPLAFVGANSVVHPGVTIGEGAVIGSQSLVLTDIEPWTVNVGAPTRTIKVRPRERMLEYARRLGYTGSASR